MGTEGWARGRVEQEHTRVVASAVKNANALSVAIEYIGSWRSCWKQSLLQRSVCFIVCKCRAIKTSAEAMLPARAGVDSTACTL